MIIYCDSCILIYALDHTGSWHRKAKDRLNEMARIGDRPATSELVRLECRVHPLRHGRRIQLADFDTFFQNPDLSWTPITRTVFERATDLRAHLGFKTVDAVHLAAAIEAGCDAFLTNDTRLAACTTMPIEVLA